MNGKIIKRLVLVAAVVLVVLAGVDLIDRKNSNNVTPAPSATQEARNTGTATPTSTATPTATLAPTDTPTPTSTPTPTPTNTPTPTPTPAIVSLVAVGDNLYDYEMLEDGYNRSNGTFDFSHNYDYIKKYLALADIAVVNQETPLGGDGDYSASPKEYEYFNDYHKWGSYHGYSTFNTPNAVADSLISAGFNVFTMATNHLWDYGLPALKHTLSFMRSTYPDVPVLGIHDSAEDQQKITVIERNGITIALLNYTYGINAWSEANAATQYIDFLTESRVTADITRAREMADFVVVFPHWGDEYDLQPNAKQKSFTQLFLKLGVDVVIGAHPHVGQPMEWFTREDGSKMVVYYSLGNFLSKFKSPSSELEGMAYVEFYKGEDGKYIKEGTIIPLVNHWTYGQGGIWNRSCFRVYALQDYTAEMANAHGTRSYGNAFSLDIMKNLAEELWGGNIKYVDCSNKGN